MARLRPYLFWFIATGAAVTALAGDLPITARLVLICAALGLALAARALGRMAGRMVRMEQEAAAHAEEQTQELERLEARLQEAQARNSAKSRFLAEMSHELRTPLNSVIGFSEMMANEVLGPHGVSAYSGYARDILASGRHLLSLADDILDLARIESGHRVLMETAVDLDTLLQDCTKMMMPAAAERQVSLVYHYDLRPPRLWADERAMRQIIINLLANAVKFTPAGGTVSVTAGVSKEGETVLVVEDTGPGIADAELPLAGAAHPRESSVDPVSGQGAGLGLAIVRALAELQGGHLNLTRRQQGGTRALLVFHPNRWLSRNP